MDSRQQRELLDGRFEIHELIGQGAQARTYRGHDHRTGRAVAIKELMLQHVDSWKAVELFEREGQVLGQLDHPNIPDYVANIHIEGEDGAERFFLIQEFVDGQDLESLLDEGLHFDEEQAVDFLRQMLEILVYLQGLSPVVIHRDIKPSNIMRRADGSLALIDFGAVQAVMPSASGGSTIVGTSGYMPVEQLMGRADTSTDLYSLAATTVHLLSGRHPNELPMEDLHLQFEDAINVSDRLEHFLGQMLAPKANRRIKNARKALQALEATQQIEVASSPARRRSRTAPRRSRTARRRSRAAGAKQSGGQRFVDRGLLGAQLLMAFLFVLMTLDVAAAAVGASYIPSEIYKIPRPVHAIFAIAYPAVAAMLVIPRFLKTSLHITAPGALLGAAALFLHQLVIAHYSLDLAAIEGSTGPGFVWLLFFVLGTIAMGRASVVPHRGRDYVAGLQISVERFLVYLVVAGLGAFVLVTSFG